MKDRIYTSQDGPTSLDEVRSALAWLPAGQEVHEGTPRMFCFSYAGGSAEMFRGWQGVLEEHVQIFPMELPGRGRRFTESFCSSVREAAFKSALAIASLPSVPFVLFGHSLGSMIAFETARCLDILGAEPPLALIVSGRHPPHVEPAVKTFHKGSDESLLDELRRFGGTPEAILADKDFLSIMLPIVRDDFRLVETFEFVPEPILHVPIYVCCGEDDEDSPYEVLTRWHELSSAPCQITLFSGGHFYINDCREELLAYIKRIVMECRNPQAGNQQEIRTNI